jgi:hypothetical protein
MISPITQESLQLLGNVSEITEIPDGERIFVVRRELKKD